MCEQKNSKFVDSNANMFVHYDFSLPVNEIIHQRNASETNNEQKMKLVREVTSR